MLIKHLAHGKGDAKRCADYLLQEENSLGEKREGIEILRGDPYYVATVADSLSFKHKYTSGVIAWAPEDNPTPEQIRAVLEDYEKTAFAGLSQDRYAFSAVLHIEKKGINIHTFCARVDLATGRSLNIAPPGHLKVYDAIRDYYNHKNGWSRPDDPERARLWRPGSHSYIRAAQVRAGLEVEPDTRGLIGSYLEQRVLEKEINNRDDVLDALKEVGLKITRASKPGGKHQYVTVKDPKSGQKYRLKGALYDANFDREQFERETKNKDERRPGGNRKLNQRAAHEAFEKMRKDRIRRAEYNRKKYSLPKLSDPQRHPDIRERSDQGVDQAIGDRPVPLNRHLRRKLGADAIPNLEYPKPTTDKATNTGADSGAKATTSTDAEEIKHGTDRTGKQSHTVVDRIAETVCAINQAIRNVGRKISTTCSSIDKSLQRTSPDLLRERGKRVMNNELSTFKREINLAEYAAGRGFKKDARKSGRTMVIMRREGDKIGIFRGRGGDQMFHDFRSLAGGTVIDFVQNEIGKNLGFVRKELRAYLSNPAPQVHIAKPKAKATAEEQTIALADEKKNLQPLDDKTYLRGRGINYALDDPWFQNSVVQDRRGNVCFPHKNEQGFCGVEKKNQGFTGYTKNTEKGVWMSSAPEQFDQIVFCESGIDCLSHAELHPDNNAAYISIAGQMSAEQEEFIKTILERNKDKEIIAAFDHDPAGVQYASDLKRLCDEAGVHKFTEQLPPQLGKDWNDVLCETRESEQQRQHDEPCMSR